MSMTPQLTGPPRFELSAEPLEPQIRAGRLPGSASGAVVTFEGLVRDHHEGRAVKGLSYQAYPALALKEGQRLLDEAAARFPLTGLYVVHRTGDLALGEAAVWIWAAAGHRREAFEAASWVLDEIKSRVPIWKLEHYADGERAWVACHHGPAHPGPARHGHPHDHEARP